MITLLYYCILSSRLGLTVQRWRNETGPRRRGEVQRAPDTVTKRQRLLYNLSSES